MFPQENILILKLGPLETDLITSLVAIDFSERFNISPVRVSNHEIWHMH